MYQFFFTHSSVSGHLGCFHILVFVNNVALNTGAHVSFRIIIFIFSGYIPGSGIARSYGGSIFGFLRNLHAVLHSGCTSLHSHQQCKRVPVFPHPLQHVIFDRLFEAGHSDQCQAMPYCSFYLHSLIISDVEHLFMSSCLLWRNFCLGLLPFISCFLFS